MLLYSLLLGLVTFSSLLSPSIMAPLTLLIVLILKEVQPNTSRNPRKCFCHTVYQMRMSSSSYYEVLKTGYRPLIGLGSFVRVWKESQMNHGKF